MNGVESTMSAETLAEATSRETHQRDHRVLPRRPRRASDVRAAHGGLPEDRCRLRDHLRQRRAAPTTPREVLAELARRDPRVVVVNHARNFGSQSAFTSGMRIASGDAVVLLDGDLQDPPELIADFVRAVAGGLRRRLRPAGQARGRRWTMQLSYKLFYRSSGRRRTSRFPSTRATSRSSTARSSTP